jgi:hypothetical protein
MSVADANNPLWLVYQELWKILRANAGYTALVKTEIDYFDDNEKFPQRKDTYTTSDFPAVKIVPGGFPPGLDASSCSAIGSMKWQIQIATGEQSAKADLDLEWQIVVAMSKWLASLHALRWNEKQFVGKCALGDSSETLEDKRENRGIRGWSAVWTGQTQLYFTTADLQA